MVGRKEELRLWNLKQLHRVYLTELQREEEN
jgi:hypothetical protein